MLHFVGVLEIILAFFVVVVVVLQKTEANKWGLVGPIDANRWRSPPVSFRLCRNLTRLWTALIEDFFCTHYSRKCRWTMTFLLQVSQALKAPWPTLLFLHMWPAAQNSSPAILTQTTPPPPLLWTWFQTDSDFFYQPTLHFCQVKSVPILMNLIKTGEKKTNRDLMRRTESTLRLIWHVLCILKNTLTSIRQGPVFFFCSQQQFYSRCETCTLSRNCDRVQWSCSIFKQNEMKDCVQWDSSQQTFNTTYRGWGGGWRHSDIYCPCLRGPFSLLPGEFTTRPTLETPPTKKKKIRLLQIHTPTVE